MSTDNYVSSSEFMNETPPLQESADFVSSNAANILKLILYRGATSGLLLRLGPTYRLTDRERHTSTLCLVKNMSICKSTTF